MPDAPMKASQKVRITVTLDPDVVALLGRLKADHGTKASAYINKVMRRHFLRPGKGIEQYTLSKWKGMMPT